LILSAAAAAVVLMYISDMYESRRCGSFFSHEIQGTATGTVTERNRKEDGAAYVIRKVTVRSGKGTYQVPGMLLYSKNGRVAAGSRVRVSGVIRPFSRKTNEGNFDPLLYYQQKRIFCCQTSDAVQIIRWPWLPVRELLSDIREKLAAVYQQVLPARTAGILCALTVGDRSGLEQEDQSDYQNHGIAHILAISGLHVSVVGLSIYRLLRRRLHVSYGVSVSVCSMVLILYGAVSGWPASSARAVIMSLSMLGAEWFGRRYDSWIGLMNAALILLLIHPFFLRQAGFQLSFCAILSIITLFPSVSALYSRLPFPKQIRCLLDHSGFVMSLTVSIGMLPLTAWYFYQIPMYALLLNLLVIPLCSVLLICGLSGGLLGLVSLTGAGILLLPCRGILTVFRMAMNLTDLLPGGTLIVGRPPLPAVAAYYAVLFGTAVWIRLLDRRLTQRREQSGAERRRKMFRRCCILRHLLTGGAAAVMGALLLVPASPSFEINLLDVGQGDGIHIQTADGSNVCIDGGSSNVSSVGFRRILPYLRYRRVRRIDWWLVSHTDEDHISGLLEVLRAGYPVSHLVLSRAAPAENAGMRELRKAAAAAGCRVVYVKEGDCLRMGNITMTCLYPRADEKAVDQNELSQVWRLDGMGISALFTGDLGKEGEERLIRRGRIRKADLLKVGHHGSKGSSSEEFLKKAAPAAALISVAEHNRYRHPSPDTLKRLHEAGARVYTTKNGGQIRIRIMKPGSREKQKGILRIERPCSYSE
jgi:competence protein ComEC